MRGFGPWDFLAALATAAVVGRLFWILTPPPRRLASRVQPYLTPSAARLSKREADTRGPLSAIFGPIVTEAADALAKLLDRSGNSITLTKLRQAGWYRGLPEKEMISGYRLRQLQVVSGYAIVGIATGLVVGGSFMVRLILAGLALVVGASRTRGQLERAIETRKDRMKIEIYTVNQLLAMRVRVGGGVIQAVQATTQRGRGEVVVELEEALRLHRAGWSGGDAFRRIAELSPEPFCSRTYRLLAAAEERGSDLAGALLALSEDVRETRRETLKRTATKRRAAMLIPTIAVLAPVLILFVAAPLPYLITSWQ
ncbi:MAG: type II secretion system F family protein [Acidimicrobiia bacterium]